MALTTEQLAVMRLAIEGKYPDTCTIQEMTHTRDETGGFKDEVDTTHSDVECFVQAVTPLRFPEQIASRMRDEPLWEIYLHWDQTVTADCRVIHDSETYEVIWPEDKQSERVFRHAWMRRLPG